MGKLARLLTSCLLFSALFLQGCADVGQGEGTGLSGDVRNVAPSAADSIVVRLVFEDGTPVGNACIAGSPWDDPTGEVMCYIPTDENGEAVIDGASSCLHVFQVWKTEDGPTIGKGDYSLMVNDSERLYTVVVDEVEDGNV